MKRYLIPAAVFAAYYVLFGFWPTLVVAACFGAAAVIEERLSDED